MKRLTAYNEQDQALFTRLVSNKSEVKREVLNNGMLALVVYVKYNNKRFNIGDIYKWKQ